MTKISGVIITFNEERFIAQCLESLQGVVDEIVVVDSFSTDRTHEICKKYGVRWVQHPFSGYTEQKNFANQQAQYDFILSLDADEALSDQLKSEIVKIKNQLEYDGYACNRLNKYCGQWIRYSNWYPDRKIRLFNKHKARWVGENNLHELIVLDQPKNCGFLSGDILHWAYDSYTEHWAKINQYTDIAARNYYRRNPSKKISFFKIIGSPLWKFFQNYFLKKGFLDGFQGLVICSLAASGTFLKYIKIRELQHSNTAG
jgi:glycosyltransferase involved in cell wall biosynthesis